MMLQAVRMILALTLLTGFIYPLAMTGVAQLIYPKQANGSLIVRGGRVTGSELIGQTFDSPRYFWPRPSSTSQFPYNAAASGGSNYGPLNTDLKRAVEARRAALVAADPGNSRPVPIDLLTTSGSGLDPHISPEAAAYQATRIARLRGLALAQVNTLIARHTEPRQCGVLGEPVVNVLLLNRDLDRL
jgi:potassium-transporting ATPase KdpC subunit